MTNKENAKTKRLPQVPVCGQVSCSTEVCQVFVRLYSTSKAASDSVLVALGTWKPD